MRVEDCEASSGELRGLRTFGVNFGLCVYLYSNGFEDTSNTSWVLCIFVDLLVWGRVM